MIITLIRHGETTWNQDNRIQGQADPPLSDLGIYQATLLSEQLTEKLKEYSIIYSSEYQRAMQTAEIIRGSHSIPIVRDPMLNSRNIGLFSGMTLEEIKISYTPEYNRWMAGDPTFVPPQGESTEKMILKVKHFLVHLQNHHKSTDLIMIITHREVVGVFIKLLKPQLIIDVLHDLPNCTPLDFKL